MGAVQYDFNAKSHGLMDVTEVCETMTDKRNGKSALERLAKLNELQVIFFMKNYFLYVEN